ncbi:preprotein translocase subunit SecG [Candidatus Wolfebacteria bacterium RIFCSPHIGHO2_01_FULL_48_22]|uniref:Protein-export membrane protein SecG n=2 Tax=Candidatus Wolfeibacteriota TaxID=1752735 RepID=A0A1F8DS12_9BACT|nr:MAG: preprotein translocase subunit SecG [Candidatus Wolfebacteria bacterium RIFCSPHIGHO2_01_FULL_48_22]OGM92109.1 MAG: preprotein translocase subunit SecG [Candidatus Wolfebacteria bacterium RIFCSPLOWO2_01_FULL_47_17b]
MSTILSVAQLAIAVILIILVLVQERGGGVGEAFGGGAEFTTQRRGIEKYLHTATIVGLVLFIATSLANLLL